MCDAAGARVQALENEREHSFARLLGAVAGFATKGMRREGVRLAAVHIGVHLSPDRVQLALNS